MAGQKTLLEQRGGDGPEAAGPEGAAGTGEGTGEGTGAGTGEGPGEGTGEGGAGAPAQKTQEEKDKECKERLMKEVTDTVNKDFNNADFEKCTTKIIHTICDTIQQNYKGEITKGIIDNIKSYLTEFAKNNKNVEKLFFLADVVLPSEADDSSTKEVYQLSETTETKPIPLALKNLTDIKSETVLTALTDKMCEYIKSPAGIELLSNFVYALRRRFDIFMKKGNKNQKIIMELLEPLVPQVRDLIKEKLLKGNLKDDLKLTFLDRLGIKTETLEGKTKEERKEIIDKGIEKMRKTFETEMSNLQTLTDKEDNWGKVPKPGQSGGNRKTKNNNKIHKKINYKQMARTLKRKLGL